MSREGLLEGLVAILSKAGYAPTVQLHSAWVKMPGPGFHNLFSISHTLV